ncbi:MAG TPA: maleylpyruvate isomerase family mycothiol-dependent enzyme [Acidimicrobiales bacterium]|nr:maleylpyruvate isomerase family mycothiol-dependent enzyme [Acidimicrobiales bacterium]
MHPDDLLEALRRESAALSETLDGDLGIPVPSCPDWTLETLVNHIGRVHRWATAAIAAKGAAVPFPGRPERIDRAWFDEGTTALISAIEEAEADDEAWNFMGEPPQVRFWIRRQTHETSIHRWDAENARHGDGSAQPIETELALDGIDELLDVVGPRNYGGDDLGGTLHLHATDSPHGEWLIRTLDGELLVGHDHQKGDAAVRGTASDLLLWIWGRTPLDADGLELFGDHGVAERFREVLKAP